MSNVISFHPPKSDLILFYEVVGEDGAALWGGTEPSEAMFWFGSLWLEPRRLLISAWESDEEDAQLIGQPIDITPLLREIIK